ncbi:phospholipase D-like domain-containing protein [Kitasatospora sp. NPDC088779]|uniref:phospholipase D-like domain-containing protein n=1 Tax=unclassified Kitasatospora TaxID=2633591 RepID=UPI00343042B9
MPTYSDNSLLHIRLHNDRQGLELVAIVDAGIPVALVTADILAQDRKPLPLLKEFVLHLVGENVDTEDAIAGILGLPQRMVNHTIAGQFSDDLLTYAAPRLGTGNQPPARRLRLTARGQQTARDMAAITPVRVDQPLVYDQLLGKAKPYDRHTIIPHRQAEEEGVLLLPAPRAGLVEASDIPVTDINALLRERGTTNREVLLVRKATQAKARRVMPAKLLVYADPERTDIQLGVVVDGELSHTHEIALLNHGGAKALGIQVEPAPERPALTPELERARIDLPQVTRLRAEQAAAQLDTEQLQGQSQAGLAIHRDQVRAISVFEHPELLDEALTRARQRILIISPWIKNAIITTDFLSKLEARLKRGTTVHIAYGYEENDTKTDPTAVRKLENLAHRYPAKLTVARLKATHAKILIFDDTWIATSFNWLSFRGDPDRTYRMEEGTLVSNKPAADDQYHRYIELIDQERR